MRGAPFLALDGWRGISILLVLASHALPGRGIPGGLGVTIFFAISGLLITGQLLDERAAHGRIDLGRFYKRRALRLLPPFLAFIVLGGIAFIACGGAIRLLAWPAALLYGANYAELATRLFDTNVAGLPHPFVILWSLAIEEHFYIVWPAALLLLAGTDRRGALAAALLGCIAVCLLWRCHLAPICAAATGACGPHGDDWIAKSTDTRLDSLAFGALAAVLLRSRRGPALRALFRSRAAVAASLALLLATLLLRDATFRDTLRYTLQGLALLVLLAGALDERHPLTSSLAHPSLVAVGRLAYGLYLFHWLALIVVSRLPGPEAARGATFLVLTGALALTSWFALERPVIARRRRAGSHASADLLPARSADVAGNPVLAG